MRKRYCMGLILALAMIAALCYLYVLQNNSVVLEMEDGIPVLRVSTQQSANRITLWQDEEDGRSYFFLPSYIDHHKITVGMDSVQFAGETYRKGDVFTWKEDTEYIVSIVDDASAASHYEITFMRSENVPAVFINTKSGDLSYLHEDKANYESGDICVVRSDGVTEYQNVLPRISGRGNSTWEYEKKPYSIKLAADYPLCGLDKDDTFRLLALWTEGSKMANKIAMDLSEALEIPYTAQGTWVDLYMNGEYRGIYLLTESVSVGEGRVDIYNLEAENRQYNPDIDNAIPYVQEDNKGYLLESAETIKGGYLIEKDHPKHYETELNGFEISSGDQFTIKAPKHASKEQVAYIQDYVQNLDDLVQNGDPAVWEYLDLDSFVRRFLVDEISLDKDTGLTSMYFYKDKDDDKLYSGPAWDYDNAFGERNSGEGYYVNYFNTIVDNNERVGAAINWYQKLYETPEMYGKMIEEYEKVLPFFEELIDVRIDEYADWIGASVKMDRVLWEDKNIMGDSSGKYADFYANVRYTKYFIAQRLNYLCQRWEVFHEPFTVPSTGQMHQVTFSVYEGVVDTVEVMDGMELWEMPEYDASVYQGWEYEYSREKYSPYIPIYEDMGFYNAKWQ